MLIQNILIFMRSAASRILPAVPVTRNERCAHSDPLSHPEIAKMTPRELADLPLGWMGAATPAMTLQHDARAACGSVQEQADGRFTPCTDCA